MSDRPMGEGWWQASDERWYPPESAAVDNAAAPADDLPVNETQVWAAGSLPPTPGGGFAPPETPPSSAPPPQSYAPPPQGYAAAPAHQHAPPPGPPPGPVGYAPPPSNQGGGGSKVWLILLAILGVVVVGIVGCSAALIFAARDSTAFEVLNELAIDFSDAEFSNDPSSCEVVGIQGDGTGDYDVTATVTNQSGVTSAYRLTYELVGPSAELLGSDFGIIDRAEPGETITDNTIGIIDAEVPWPDVACNVISTERVDVN